MVAPLSVPSPDEKSGAFHCYRVYETMVIRFNKAITTQNCNLNNHLTYKAFDFILTNFPGCCCKIFPLPDNLFSNQY